MDVVKAKAYLQLARVDKPIGTLLLLWPTLWALFIAANGVPDLHILSVFVVGVVLMRSAGCVINDVADRNFDRHVTRTKNRVIAAGRVTPKGALIFFIALISLAFLLVLTLNSLTIALSIIAAILASVYPFMKRVTYMPQLVLGLAFSSAIPMAFGAQTGTIPLVAWLLFAANLLWTIAYDTLYAMVDREDDLKIGIKSSAILFGRHDKLWVGILQLSTVLLLIGVGILAQLASVYYWSVLCAAVLFVYQQRLIKTRDGGNCFQAFLNNNYVGMLIFIGIGFSVLPTFSL